MWLLDLGNTRLKLTRADGRGAGDVTALAHGDADFEHRLRRTMSKGEAWLASVAPEGLRCRVEAVLLDVGVNVRHARTQPELAGVRIAYADPARLGVDRFLGLLAARARGGDRLVASFGSAVTVDLLDAAGTHHGGLIGIA